MDPYVSFKPSSQLTGGGALQAPSQRDPAAAQEERVVDIYVDSVSNLRYGDAINIFDVQKYIYLPPCSFRKLSCNFFSMKFGECSLDQRGAIHLGSRSTALLLLSAIFLKFRELCSSLVMPLLGLCGVLVGPSSS